MSLSFVELQINLNLMEKSRSSLTSAQVRFYNTALIHFNLH